MTPRSVGAVVALYERAVGIYASLVNINAYHQPGLWFSAFNVCQPGKFGWLIFMPDKQISLISVLVAGVEAGKKAAGEVLALQKRVLAVLNAARFVAYVTFLLFVVLFSLHADRRKKRERIHCSHVISCSMKLLNQDLA